MSFGSFVKDLLPTFITGAAGVAGGIMDYRSQSKANEMNRNLAREQMVFQERMSNSAYQRATEDMKKAGINPMLAYAQGGASSPPGSTAVMQPATSRAIHSGLALARFRSELDKIHSDTSLNNAMRRAAENDAYVKANTARQIATQTQLLRYKLPGAKTEGDIDSKLYGKTLRYVDRASPLGKLAITAARALMRHGGG